mmetsp:Transcript_28879/g.79606  ORF Transcript_28879/g.79606 Transcript_28879/m.79606 type:complete len:431 (+) Transcript_28879:100-1392(+)
MQRQQRQHMADIHPAQFGKATYSDVEVASFLNESKRRIGAIIFDCPGGLRVTKSFWGRQMVFKSCLALNVMLLLVILGLASSRKGLTYTTKTTSLVECELNMDVLRAHVRDSGQEVCSRRVAYSPAAWEQDFVANMSSYQCGAEEYAVGAVQGICPALCERVRLYTPLVREWVRSVQNQSAWHWRPTSAIQQGTWSSFMITTSCPNGLTTTTEAPIEPLVSFLRHPLALCLDGDRSHVLDKSYMLIGVPASISAGRRFLFDIGASEFLSGAGGASQSWFVESYRTVLGVDFDRIFCWEYGGNQADRLRETPFEILTKTSYFVIPASGEPNKCHNPWNFIREVCKPGDFVVVKLDMDTPEVETALVEQLLQDHSLARLIDDFYFEDHVSKSPMEYHGWRSGIERPKHHDLARSIKIFAQLREMGIRAHSWV